MSLPKRLIRVLLLDDHLAMTGLMRRLLDVEEDFQVVGTAASLRELKPLLQNRIDVALLDYQLPDGTGAQAARQVKAHWPRAQVVMFSALRDDETMLEAIQAGADAYLAKEEAVEEEVVATLRAVMAGELLLAPQLIAAIDSRVERLQGQEQPTITELTAREHSVLDALARGLSTPQMCAELGIGRNTARTHIQHVIKKLQAHSKLEAVALGLRYRLIAPPLPSGARAQR